MNAPKLINGDLGRTTVSALGNHTMSSASTATSEARRIAHAAKVLTGPQIRFLSAASPPSLLPTARLRTASPYCAHPGQDKNLVGGGVFTKGPPNAGLPGWANCECGCKLTHALPPPAVPYSADGQRHRVCNTLAPALATAVAATAAAAATASAPAAAAAPAPAGPNAGSASDLALASCRSTF